MARVEQGTHMQQMAEHLLCSTVRMLPPPAQCALMAGGPAIAPVSYVVVSFVVAQTSYVPPVEST